MADLPTTITYTDIVAGSLLSSSKTNTDFGNVFDATNEIIAWGEDIEDDVDDNTDLIATVARGIKYGVKTRWATDTTITLTHTSLGMTNGTIWHVFEAPAATITLTLGDASGGLPNLLDTGSVAADTWYAVYSIAKADYSGQAGILSLSGSAPSLASITGYSGGYYRRRGWVRSDSSSKIVIFTVIGEEWRIKASNNEDETPETWNRVASSGNGGDIDSLAEDTWTEWTVSTAATGIETVLLASRGDRDGSLYARERGSATGTGPAAGEETNVGLGSFVGGVSDTVTEAARDRGASWVGLDADGKIELLSTNNDVDCALWMIGWHDDF